MCTLKKHSTFFLSSMEQQSNCNTDAIFQTEHYFFTKYINLVNSFGKPTEVRFVCRLHVRTFTVKVSLDHLNIKADIN